MKNLFSLAIMLSCTSLLFSQVSKTNNTIACVSVGSVDRTVVFNASDFPTCTALTDVNITIHYRLTDNLSGNPGGFGVHEDLDFDLISPSNTVVPLIQENRNPPLGCALLQACNVGGVCEASFVGSFTYIDGTVTLDQSASTPINQWNGGGCATTEAPVSGTYQPHEGRSLDDFNGENPIGTWILRITDPFDNFGDVNCLMDFTLTVSCATLPVELIDFNAVPFNDQFVQLDWRTASETSNKEFEIQHSSNGIDWIKKSTVAGQGNSDQFQDYQFQDYAAIEGDNYYRLKQIDYDGKFTYSEIKTVSFKSSERLELYPNPAKEIIHIKWKNSIPESVYYEISNEIGKEVIKEKLIDNRVNINTLPNGIYFLKIYTFQEIYFQTFIVQD